MNSTRMLMGVLSGISLGLDFTYSGEYAFSGDPKGDWEIELLTSGTFNFKSIQTNIDLFLVGGGASGGSASGGIAGAGGGGGGGGRGLSGAGGSGIVIIRNAR